MSNKSRTRKKVIRRIAAQITNSVQTNGVELGAALAAESLATEIIKLRKSADAWNQLETLNGLIAAEAAPDLIDDARERAYKAAHIARGQENQED